MNSKKNLNSQSKLSNSFLGKKMYHQWIKIDNHYNELFRTLLETKGINYQTSETFFKPCQLEIYFTGKTFSLKDTDIIAHDIPYQKGSVSEKGVFLQKTNEERARLFFSQYGIDLLQKSGSRCLQTKIEDFSEKDQNDINHLIDHINIFKKTTDLVATLLKRDLLVKVNIKKQEVDIQNYYFQDLHPDEVDFGEIILTKTLKKISLNKSYRISPKGLFEHSNSNNYGIFVYTTKIEDTSLTFTSHEKIYFQRFLKAENISIPKNLFYP